LFRRGNLQGSTFLNKGAAFPHARLEGLTSPIFLAMGIARQGIEDAAGIIPSYCVFLILTPANQPEMQVRILAKASGIVRNNTLMSDMISAKISEEVFDLLRHNF